MSRIAIFTTLFVSTFALSACETVKGVGRDITNAADTVSQAF